VARASTLSEAAQALGVNQTTVSRHLAAMETRLGTTLLDRAGRKVALSAAGQDLARVAERVEAEMLQAEARLLGHDRRTEGRVTLTCPDILIDQYLAPHIARFSGDFPGIDLQIISIFDPVDLMRREADVAIRVSGDPPEPLVGRRAAGFATTAYVASDQSDASDLPWIGWTNAARQEALIGPWRSDAAVRHRTDGMVAMRALVRAGLGVSVLPCYWADRDPGLMRLDPAVPPARTNGIWVLAHPDVSRAARVRALSEFLYQTIRRDRALFEGRV